MEAARPLVVRIRPGRDQGRLRAVVGWVSALLPAAILLVGAPAPTPEVAEEVAAVVTLDADDLASPLSVADAISRGLQRRG